MLTQFKFCLGVTIASVSMLALTCGDANAQRRSFQIGGSQGVVIGGGMGLRIGGRNGVQFGGGEGARFGPPATGVQFGGGQGARFGPSSTGVQFGGGQGAKFGALQLGGTGNPSTFNRNPQSLNSNGQPAGVAPNDRKVLSLPAEASQPVRYSLNGTQFQLQPGDQTFLQKNQDWTVKFSPVPGQPERAVGIVELGVYEFSEGADGWELSTPTAMEPAPSPADASEMELDEPILAPTPTDIIDVPAPSPGTPRSSGVPVSPSQGVDVTLTDDPAASKNGAQANSANFAAAPAATKTEPIETKKMEAKPSSSAPQSKPDQQEAETRKEQSVLEWKSSPKKSGDGDK